MFSIIALCMLTSCPVNWVSVSLSASLIELSSMHLANKCSSLNGFLLQYIQGLIVGLMGVMLNKILFVVCFSEAVEYLLCVLIKHGVQSVRMYLYAIFSLS